MRTLIVTIVSAAALFGAAVIAADVNTASASTPAAPTCNQRPTGGCWGPVSPAAPHSAAPHAAASPTATLPRCLDVTGAVTGAAAVSGVISNTDTLAPGYQCCDSSTAIDAGAALGVKSIPGCI